MYGEILKTPGVWRVYVASIVGRLPMGALGLLLILRTRDMTGSYAAGGAVSAAYAIALGVAGPLLGRIVGFGTFVLEPAVLEAELAPQEMTAYARLLLDILEGDNTLSIRADEAEEAWRIVTPILEAWGEGAVPLQEYPAGSAFEP